MDENLVIFRLGVLLLELVELGDTPLEDVALVGARDRD